MTAAMAMPGNTAGTFLVHFFGTGLSDDRYVIQRFKALADGDIRPWPSEEPATGKGRRRAKRITVPAGGDAQHSAHRGHPMMGLIRLHELEDLPGIVPVSRANQAAAFFNISRSSRSWQFSRRSRRSSSSSKLVRPSSRRPSSRSV